MSDELDPFTIKAIAREVAALPERRPEPGQMLTAGQVAARFNVTRGWVYAHARELGVVRLTGSHHSRLRFDPAVVAERLLAEPPADPPTVAGSEPRRRFAQASGEVPLLPVRGRMIGVENRPADDSE